MLHLSHHLDPNWKTGCWLNHRSKNAKVSGDHHKYDWNMLKANIFETTKQLFFALDLSENWNQFEECWLLPRTPTIPYPYPVTRPPERCLLLYNPHKEWPVKYIREQDQTWRFYATLYHTTIPWMMILRYDLSMCVAQIPVINIEFPMSDASITILLINYTPEYVKSLNPHEQNHWNHAKSPFSMAKSI
jgi:hypothetical protein